MPTPTPGAGWTGGTSKTIGNKRLNKDMVRVDVEFPTGESTGNVHVQVKGPGGPQKYYINDPADLSALPRYIRNDPEIVKWIGHGFDLLRRYQP
jgi:hypothetical protein